MRNIVAWEKAQALWDEIQTAERLNLKSPRALQNWRCKGYGPPFLKIGRLVRYRPEDIEDWLTQQTRQSTSEAPKGE